MACMTVWRVTEDGLDEQQIGGGKLTEMACWLAGLLAGKSETDPAQTTGIERALLSINMFMLRGKVNSTQVRLCAGVRA